MINFFSGECRKIGQQRGHKEAALEGSQSKKEIICNSFSMSFLFCWHFV